VSPTVLIVEDEPDLARLLAEVLEDEGYRVVLSSPTSAADQAASRAPHLILIDYSMPGLTGGQVLEQMRMGGAMPPVVLVTARPDAPALALSLGAQGYLRKPFDVDELLTLVGQLAPRG
jgi:DNA-binding response OmpR family regulator